MGAWSTGSFGNDTALDFVAGLSDTKSLARALNGVGDKGERTDSDIASEAVAAADIVAALIGRASTDLPENIEGSLAAFGTPDSALISSAISAVQHLRDTSELADLWAESPDEDWTGAIDDLLARLDLSTDYVAPPQVETDGADPETMHFGSSCCFCGKSVSESDEVSLIISDDEGWSTMTMYSHRKCVVKNFEPPHFDANGTPHAQLLAQVRKSFGM